MKLRRTLALAAATAVIAPVSLLSATAAYADTRTTPTATASASVSPSASTTPSVPASPTGTATPPSKSPETTPTEADPSKSATVPPGKNPSAPPTRTPSATPSTPEEGPEELPGEDTLCEDVQLDVALTGLPGKIAAGSGWHEFNLNFHNNSKRAIKSATFIAGAAGDELGDKLFTTKQVQLQAYDDTAKTWITLGEEGYSAGYLGSADMPADFEVDIKMRLDVKAGVPAGSGFTLGGGIFVDEAEECIGFGDTTYKFQIVKAGTDTEGTKPQEGGKTPIKVGGKPSTSVPQVTGNLAETGASSQMPVFGIAGGAAVLLGVGALVLVRRRNSDA